MKAIILAAGVGRRLGKDGQNQPKSLLRFNGKSLLQRHLEYLRHCQIEQVAIAVGIKIGFNVQSRVRIPNSRKTDKKRI